MNWEAQAPVLFSTEVLTIPQLKHGRIVQEPAHNQARQMADTCKDKMRRRFQCTTAFPGSQDH